MYQVSANKQYDGIISQEKYTPKKSSMSAEKFFNQHNIFEVSPSAVKQDAYWEEEDESLKKEKRLNAKYMQRLEEQVRSKPGDGL